MTESYLTTKQAATALGLSLRAVVNRIQAGTLRAQRVGARGLLIPPEEVERFRGVGRLRRGPKPNRKKVCAACRSAFTAAGRGAYCGAICKQRAYRQRRREREQAGEQQGGDSTDQLPALP